MEKQQIGLVGLATIIAMLLTVPIAYAGSQANLGATLTIGNAAPTIYDVSCNKAVTPQAGVRVNTTCVFNVTDNNGIADLKPDGAFAWFRNGTGAGGTLPNMTCFQYANFSNTTSGYNCTFGWWYYLDSNRNWNLSINISDGATTTTNASTGINVTPNALTSLVLVTPTDNVTFGTIAAGTASGATNDPVIFNNTGNQHITQINISANNLTGHTTITEHIYAANFTGNDLDAAGGEALGEETNVTIIGTAVPYGLPATAQDSIYLYVTPSIGLSNQDFSATKTGRIWVWGVTNV